MVPPNSETTPDTSQADSETALSSRPTAGRTVAALLIAGMLLVAASVFATVVLTVQSKAISEQVKRTLEIDSAAQALLSRVQAAGIGQRGFLLTRNAIYLKSYEEARGMIADETAHLRNAVNGNKVQEKRVESIDNLVDKKLAELGLMIELSQQGRHDEAIAIFNTDRGHQLLLQIEEEIGNILSGERVRLLKLQQEDDDAKRLLAVAEIISIVLASLLAVTAIVLINRRYVRIAKDRNEIALSAAELERRIADRTAELDEAREAAVRDAERIQLLLRDVHHRVGNSLQLVAAFLGLQANSIGTPEARSALNAARERVLAIASAQRRLRLTESGNVVEAEPFVRAMISDLSANLDEISPVDVSCDVDNLTIPSKDAVSIGIIVNELVTNSLKYAFPKDETGTVSVSLTTRHEGETFVLEVADNGIGLGGSAEQTAKGGLGTRIVDRLTGALGGEVERSPVDPSAARPGTRIRVIFPNPEIL